MEERDRLQAIAETWQRALAVVAHPDDETFGCGGVLAKYAAEGAQVFLLCATRGEVGEIRDPALATRDNLGR
jgi:LmbE family N-acetylglucosaminyl deacetylase